MREIKFRVWEKFYKTMHYEDVSHFASLLDNGVLSTVSGFGGDNIAMQYTNKDDAEINGNEIYEGDIIQNCDTKDLEVVFWNEEKAAWYCYYNDNENRIISLCNSLGNLNKKVGNIYENPELLTSK